MNKYILVVVRVMVFLRLWQSPDGICNAHVFVLTWIQGEGEGVNKTREYIKSVFPNLWFVDRQWSVGQSKVVRGPIHFFFIFY